MTYDAVFDSEDDETEETSRVEVERDVIDASDEDERRARGQGAPAAEFRLTCPDKTGLGADICRVAFEFGLVVTRGDFSTDGVWALVLLTVRAGKVRAGDVRVVGERKRSATKAARTERGAGGGSNESASGASSDERGELGVREGGGGGERGERTRIGEGERAGTTRRGGRGGGAQV